MEELVDVIEVEIKPPHAERVMKTALTQDNAKAFISVAVFRRGVETHFYVTRPSTPRKD